jgi:hypothetical protein
MKDSNRKAMFAKARKLENFLEHARTQEVPISRKEDQLIRLKKKLGENLDRDQEQRFEQLQRIKRR